MFSGRWHTGESVTVVVTPRVFASNGGRTVLNGRGMSWLQA
jgi:hypothetical protein